MLLAAILLLAALTTTQAAFAAAPDVSGYLALVKQDLRLAIVGHRLASANAPFCARKNRNPGWVLHDKSQYPDHAIAQAAFGFRAPVAVSVVVPGGAAEALGIKPGDGIMAVNGVNLSASNFVQNERASARLEKLQDMLADVLDTTGTADIMLTTANGPKWVTLAPPAICASRFWLDTKSKLDAGADGASVRVTEGLMAFTANDESQLAAVVAHEMSHNLLGHRQRLAANGNSNKLILETEVEADRLTVWLMANAGYDTAAALRFIERYGRNTGLGVLSVGTHLRWKNRRRVMQQEIALIEQAVAKNGLRPPPLLTADKL
ncbi:M48 family metalloprotease [Sphingorhabdus sp.]|uniref:M48 family metalloprotease n=1 Tax=Sphingorhabdus sp. TaxID=1902408 RepID=UPI003918E017